MAEENKYNITIETGADFVLPFLWETNGIPKDLTGTRIEAQLREYPEAVDVIDFTCSHNGEGGTITITLPNEVTKAIAYTYGVYDVFVVYPDGTKKRPLRGDVKIQHYVTKPLDGTGLFMVGISSYEDLPAVGNINRLYFCYAERKIFRWNGANYIATSIGNGIQKIEFKEHSSAFTDTYTIVYDDGSTWDFQVTSKGIESIELIGSTGSYLDGTVDTYRIHFNNGTYYDYEVHGGRVVFPVFDVDWDTGMLYVVDGFANVTFSITESTGMLSFTY